MRLPHGGRPRGLGENGAARPGVAPRAPTAVARLIALGYGRRTVQIDSEKYLVLCFAIAAGCGSAEATRVVKEATPAAPAPVADAAAPVLPPEPAAAAVSPPSPPPKAHSEDPEMDAIAEELEKIGAARRDCNPAPNPEYVRQLELQHVEGIPNKESPLNKACDKIEGPSTVQIPGPACEDPFFDCYAAVKMLRPESARAYVACLKPKSKTRGMCGHGPGNCVVRAVNVTAPSPGVTAVCARIAQRCRAAGGKPLAEMMCRKYLTAVDCDEVEQAGYCLANACSMRQCFDPIDEPERAPKGKAAAQPVKRKDMGF
jgi:hypothetical protein